MLKALNIEVYRSAAGANTNTIKVYKQIYQHKRGD